jgi:hypothetical protein
MKPSEYLQHFQLQDLSLELFQIIDAAGKIEDTRKRAPAVIMAAVLMLDRLEGEVDTGLTAAVRALVDARVQETEHYKAARDFIAHEV